MRIVIAFMKHQWTFEVVIFSAIFVAIKFDYTTGIFALSLIFTDEHILSGHTNNRYLSIFHIWESSCACINSDLRYESVS